MADREENIKAAADSESVDDILAGIINKDGSFNDEFNGLFSRYLGGEPHPVADAAAVDISDRSGELQPRRRVEYEDPDIPFRQTDSVRQSIEEKLPENVRGLYEEAEAEAQRPEFTSSGDVRYPTMGVGAAEERVVFDADWEEKAKKEAARLQRVREDRMLRGDSAYARAFVAGGRPMIDPLSDTVSSRTNPAYIDPLSDDDDFPPQSLYLQGGRQPFFSAGFPANQERNNAAGGKTQKTYRGAEGASQRGGANDKPDWAQVAKEPERKKRRASSRRKIDTVIGTKRELTPMIPDWQPQESAAAEEKKPADIFRPKKHAVDYTEMLRAEDETQELKCTVQEIVDKYNKREQDERERKEKEEEEIREAKRRKEAEEEAQRLEAEKKRAGVSEDIIQLIDGGELEDEQAESYDDFSAAAPDRASVQESAQDMNAAEPQNEAADSGDFSDDDFEDF